ncbi:MAG TPA: glycosyltransferase family 2 protein [Bacteroidales bacterium]|jgi:glycosyltransferase involved in cell wall biosynthesis|nr:glycosyltransferase family 2 protein [Bacteroidales bacterium]
MKNITGIITTLNEERNIEEAIRSLQQVCNEIIVVDSLSEDNTVEIAKKAGAQVVLQAYLGDGIQKNVGIKYASNKWIFSLDADERLSEELVQEINKLDFSEGAKYDSYAVKRKNFIGSRWIKVCRWYPDYLVRLFRHDKTRFLDVKQHSSVPPVRMKKLSSAILHYRYKNIDELFAKPERNYSTRGAKILYLQGKKVNAFSPVWHGSVAFIVNYFIRGGFLGGIDGLTLSKAIAHNSYMKYAKLLEYYRDSEIREKEDFEKVW